jgi:hypothetical protein
MQLVKTIFCRSYFTGFLMQSKNRTEEGSWAGGFYVTSDGAKALKEYKYAGEDRSFVCRPKSE